MTEDAEFGNAIYDAIYEWKDEDFTVDRHLTRRVAQVLMDQGYRKQRDWSTPNLAKRQAETELALLLLESKIEQAKVSIAEIYGSGDESRYWVAKMYERQIERSTLHIKKTRKDIERWTVQP